MFSVYLGHYGREQSKLWIGGYSQDQIRSVLELPLSEDVDSKIMWADVSSHYFWSVRLLSVVMNNSTLHTSVQHVVFDTGASLNYMPSREWQHFLKQILALNLGCY